MSFSYEEALDRLSCPHSNCDYHNVITEISATYVEDKLTIQKSCRNCNGRDHLMFEVQSYKTSIEHASVGDKFRVNESVRVARASEGDILTVTAISENPRAVDNPLYGGDNIIIGLTRNLESDSNYRTGTLSPDRFSTLLSKDKIEKIDN